jgi:hypothetical protein
MTGVNSYNYNNSKDNLMRLLIKIFAVVSAFFFYAGSFAYATPSTIVWIPSVDVQSYGVYHLGIDNYFTVFKKGVGEGGAAFPTDIGLTIGILPFSGIQAEIGIDLLEPLHSPWSINAKVALPEGTLSEWAPAFSIGICNVGFEKNVTDINMLHILTAKTFPIIGRLSAGYFQGNSKILVDENLRGDNAGILLSWDKQMTEINENLWLAIDYQSGNNFLGAFSFGFAWSFSKNVSVIFARNIFNNPAYPSTFTTQLDINI